MFIKDKIVGLRALEPDDLDMLYEWENNMCIWQVSDTRAPFSKYVLAKYLQNSHRDIYETHELRLMIVELKENKPVGLIDIFDFDPYHGRAGLGILINNKQNRHKGFAAAALELVINYTFSTLGLAQLYCNIAENNTKSLGLFSKAGFTIAGKKIAWNRTPDGFENEFLLQKINPKLEIRHQK